MKLKPLSLILPALIASPLALSEPLLYGKANVSAQLADEGDGSKLELKSNASRLGVKGSEKLEETGLEVIYQMEFEVQVDDGDETFKQRNIFIGLKGGFGTVKAGKFDSPLKVAQNKVDLFNDLEGDIKNMITVNDNRPSNIVSYTTPKANGFSASAAIIASEDEDVDNGASVAVQYTLNDLYLAAAFDSGVEGEEEEALRFVAQYSVGDFTLGGLIESHDDNGESTDGWMLSAKYKIDDWALKAQFGQSDIKEEDADTLSLGADYKLSKTFKTFFYYTKNQFVEEGADVDGDYLGAGVELKF
jgi:predicted porin